MGDLRRCKRIGKGIYHDAEVSLAGDNSINALGYEIHNRLRYSQSPCLHLDERSMREDVRRVRHLIPAVKGIGPKALAVVDAWLTCQKSRGKAKGMTYLRTLPGVLPAGMVLVHNHVQPTRKLGSRGVRAWLAAPDPATLERCGCGWAPELGQHFRVREARLNG